MCTSNCDSIIPLSKLSKTLCKCSGSSGISKLSSFSQAASFFSTSQAVAKGAAMEHVLANSVKGISSQAHCCPAVSKHCCIILQTFPPLFSAQQSNPYQVFDC